MRSAARPTAVFMFFQDINRAHAVVLGFDPIWIDHIQDLYGQDGVQAVTSATRHFTPGFIREAVDVLGVWFVDMAVQVLMLKNSSKLK